MSAPERLTIGTRIDFIPAAGMLPPMVILDTRECETDFARPEPHLAYKVIGPDGNEDWICGHDAERHPERTF